MTTTFREHDFTNPTWGHNLSILNWDKDARTGRAMCWVTPGLKDGDIVIVKSERGSMRMVASDVKWMSNVDDMYSFTISPEIVEEAVEDEQLWVTKVRRNGGGTSVLDIASTKEKAQALADEFNTDYQTDNYYIEPYNEKTHAYSRNG